MKSLLRIERVAVIRWSTLAFVAVLLFPLFFLRYGNTGAVVQSAMVMALVFCQIFVGRFGVSFSPFERLFLGRFGFGQSCGLSVIA